MTYCFSSAAHKGELYWVSIWAYSHHINRSQHGLKVFNDLSEVVNASIESECSIGRYSPYSQDAGHDICMHINYQVDGLLKGK